MFSGRTDILFSACPDASKMRTFVYNSPFYWTVYMI
nr:MAG TPA: hypothetical protein [Caudoviricetes sp.]DAP69604.1 MAG TPA: hypothetical protein [Caudoviricetes sp.]